jgi:hypothetical protein
VGPRAVLDAVVKRKIPGPRRELNPRTPIVQPLIYLNVKAFIQCILFFLVFYDWRPSITAFSF